MTNNKQQTAVEWFIEQLEEKGKAYEENQVVRTINICIDVSDYMELKQQANERHKQQIINAVDDQNNYDSWPSSIPTLGEQYYSEAYGGNK
jgi:LmbE family N-acetylglucosaminyl deacetylase